MIKKPSLIFATTLYFVKQWIYWVQFFSLHRNLIIPVDEMFCTGYLFCHRFETTYKVHTPHNPTPHENYLRKSLQDHFNLKSVNHKSPCN